MSPKHNLPLRGNYLLEELESVFLRVSGCSRRLRTILGAEYELVAMHSSPVHAYFVGMWLSGKVKFDVGKYVMSHLLDTAHCFLQKTPS